MTDMAFPLSCPKDLLMHEAKRADQKAEGVAEAISERENDLKRLNEERDHLLDWANRLRQAAEAI